MAKIKFITTPLYYVNASPHIGHAYTQIAADCLSRYYRSTGREVYFLTGTDEHGEKIAQAAEVEGRKVEEFVDQGVERFKELWDNLEIEYDQFIRTTQKEHINTVEKVLNQLRDKGLIYKDLYEGWYCVPCESFYTPSQVKQGNVCPECNRELEKLKQESYFFKLSKFKKPLLKHIRENPDFIMPDTRRNEILGFLDQPLKDLSISRIDVRWGIPINFDSKHTVYVWFDALLNYISAPGYESNKDKFNKIWPADVQLIGKDILKFHAVIWPAMLMALDLELPKTIFAHGWWTVKGEKMSKSLGNVVNPINIIDKWGVSALRYFLLRQISFGADGIFSEQQFSSRYETELANELGNLLSRVLGMIEKYQPDYTPGPDDGFSELSESIIKELDVLYEKLQFNTVLEEIWVLIKKANTYVEETKPWQLKNEDPEKLNVVLTNLFEVLKIISQLIYPFMPGTSKEMKKQMGIENLKMEEFLQWNPNLNFDKIKKGKALFPKI